MDIQRTFLALTLCFVTLLLWQEWEKDYNQPKTVAAQTQAGPTSNTSAVTPANSALPAGAVTTTNSANLNNGRYVQIQTDVLQLTLDVEGGDLVEASLPAYPHSLSDSTPFMLMTQKNGRSYIAQTGILGIDGPDTPQSRARYQPEQSSYFMAEGQKDLQVVLSWTNPSGVTFKKIYKFERGSYLVKIEHQIQNASAANLSYQIFAQLRRDREADHSTAGGAGLATYSGGAYSTPEERYKKYSFGDMDDKALKLTVKGGWIAMLQHYFLTAFVPTDTDNNEFYSQVLANKESIMGYLSPMKEVAAGSNISINSQIYMGPKIQSTLEKIAPHLDLVVDYGFLWWIAQPLFHLMKWFHQVVGNWGLAIILVTLSVKTLLFKLSAAQYRSMAKMKDLQPKLAQLKERYGSDRQKMSQGMMELYSKEKVNPLGGCLPLLIQMPIFLALYWMLMESVELRQAPFFGWIQDLASKDPYYLLPLLMGLSMYLMQKMSPSPVTDPMQQRVMQLMPVLMTGFFIFFPSGLVLYWVVNNSLSIVQQHLITKSMEKSKLKTA
jgi:YidC/Oxa1 family membrane protein insertase